MKSAPRRGAECSPTVSGGTPTCRHPFIYLHILTQLEEEFKLQCDSFILKWTEESRRAKDDRVDPRMMVDVTPPVQELYTQVAELNKVKGHSTALTVPSGSARHRRIICLREV